MIKIEVPKIPAVYTGSGDLFAALFLAHSYLQDSVKSALENTLNSLHDVLLKTYEYSQGKYRNINLFIIVHTAQKNSEYWVIDFQYVRSFRWWHTKS